MRYILLLIVLVGWISSEVHLFRGVEGSHHVFDKVWGGLVAGKDDGEYADTSSPQFPYAVVLAVGLGLFLSLLLIPIFGWAILCCCYPCLVILIIVGIVGLAVHA